jgi:hypothetical protein
MNKQGIAEMNMQSAAFAIEQAETYGLYDAGQAAIQLQKLKLDILALTEVYRILQITDQQERESQLRSLKARLEPQ